MLSSLIFITLGIYLIFFFQRDLLNQSDEEPDSIPTETRRILQFIRLIGWVFLIYSILEMTPLGPMLWKWIRGK